MHGLPLQLSPEEVTLAIEEGWGILKGPAGGEEHAADAASALDKKRKWSGARYIGDDVDDSEDDNDNDYYNYNNNDEEEPPLPPWQDALAHGSLFEIPTTAEEVQGHIEDISNDGNKSKIPVAWPFPATTDERHRYFVFRDLHRRGFRITGGSKFGADFLLYPGDPCLYHAQLCVRLMPYGTSILPALLASACRGSFQARKHLLIASVVEGSDTTDLKSNPKVHYMTFGPVDGFG